MIDRTHPLPLIRQAEALAISRGSVYYQPRPVSEADLALMKRIDRLHLDRAGPGCLNSQTQFHKWIPARSV